MRSSVLFFSFLRSAALARTTHAGLRCINARFRSRWTSTNAHRRVRDAAATLREMALWSLRLAFLFLAAAGPACVSGAPPWLVRLHFNVGACVARSAPPPASPLARSGRYDCVRVVSVWTLLCGLRAGGVRLLRPCLVRPCLPAGSLRCIYTDPLDPLDKMSHYSHTPLPIQAHVIFFRQSHLL